MSSEVDICNLALAHLGDTATVASLDPPEGSVQAEHCARFYPIARDALLEMHTWDFATTRSSLSLLSETVSPWAYAYAVPNLMLKAIAVISSGASDDYSMTYSEDEGYLSPTGGEYTPQPFSLETVSSGAKVILTNQEDAVLRYTRRVTDSAKFSGLFTMALSWMLASMLAGPLIKGDAGSAEAKRCTQMAMGYISQARVNDANQRAIKPNHVVPWLAGR